MVYKRQVGPCIAPLGLLVVAAGQRGLCAYDLLEVGVLIRVGVLAIEPTNDHRPLVNIGTIDVVGGEQHHARSPAVAVDAEVLAPFVHHRIVDDIGRPEVAVDIIILGSQGRPGRRIEVGQADGTACGGGEARYLRMCKRPLIGCSLNNT